MPIHHPNYKPVPVLKPIPVYRQVARPVFIPRQAPVYSHQYPMPIPLYTTTSLHNNSFGSIMLYGVIGASLLCCAALAAGAVTMTPMFSALGFVAGSLIGLSVNNSNNNGSSHVDRLNQSRSNSNERYL